MSGLPQLQPRLRGRIGIRHTGGRPCFHTPSRCGRSCRALRHRLFAGMKTGDVRVGLLQERYHVHQVIEAKTLRIMPLIGFPVAIRPREGDVVHHSLVGEIAPDRGLKASMADGTDRKVFAVFLLGHEKLLGKDRRNIVHANDGDSR